MAAMTHLSVSKLHDSVINFYICLLRTRTGVFTSGPSRAADILTSAQKHKVICYLRVQAAVQVSVGQIKPLFNTKKSLLSRLVCFSAGPQLVPHCHEVAADPNHPLLEFMPPNSEDGLSTIHRQHNKDLPDIMSQKHNINVNLIDAV